MLNCKICWINLTDRRRDLRLALLLKIVKGKVAVPADTVNLSLNNSRIRSSHQFKFNHIPSNTSQFKHSFIPRTIPQWNILSEIAVNAKYVTNFKATRTRQQDPPRCTITQNSMPEVLQINYPDPDPNGNSG